MKVTNFAPGARGINLKGGSTLWVDPGQEVEFDKDQVVGDLPDFGKASDAAPQDDRVTELEDQLATAQARIAELEDLVTAPADSVSNATSGAPVGLTGKTKPQLQDIAKAEGVDVADDATNAQIVEAIEAKRAA